MANLVSLMSGGWEPDNDMDIASDYELAMEQAEAEHPELFRVVWESSQPCQTCTANMFEYVVYWHDCDGAGYSESGVQYRGSDRMAAIKAKHYADEHCCGGSIDIRLLWKDESRGERINRLEEEMDLF